MLHHVYGVYLSCFKADKEVTFYEPCFGCDKRGAECYTHTEDRTLRSAYIHGCGLHDCVHHKGDRFKKARAVQDRYEKDDSEQHRYPCDDVHLPF